MNQQDRLAARRPSVALLEERVHRLESRVTTLADALRLLARAGRRANVRAGGPDAGRGGPAGS